MALQHGGAGSGSGETPASPSRPATRRRRPSAAPCTSCASRHRRAAPTPPTRCGRHCTPTDDRAVAAAATGQGDRPADPRVRQVLAVHARAARRRRARPCGALSRRPARTGAVAVELLVAQARGRRRSSRALFASSSATVSAGVTPDAPAPRAPRIGPVDRRPPCRGRRRPRPCLRSQRTRRARDPRRCGAATTPTVHSSPGTAERPDSSPPEERANATASGVGRREVVGGRRGPLTRHGAPRPARSSSSMRHAPGPAPSAAARTARRCSSAFTGVGTPWSAAQQHDLAVEELRLDRTGAAGEALPARPALPLARGRRRQLQGVAAPLAVLLGAGDLDPGRGEHVLALALGLAPASG